MCSSDLALMQYLNAYHHSLYVAIQCWFDCLYANWAIPRSVPTRQGQTVQLAHGWNPYTMNLVGRPPLIVPHSPCFGAIIQVWI